jgi:hypothetical protein
MITADPRSCGRPAEAVRIAAGLTATRRFPVTVYLHGPAILTLGENVDDLVDGENFDRYWPVVGDAIQGVWVQHQAAELTSLGVSRLPFREASPAQLAALLRTSTYVIRF